MSSVSPPLTAIREAETTTDLVTRSAVRMRNGGEVLHAGDTTMNQTDEGSAEGTVRVNELIDQSIGESTTKMSMIEGITGAATGIGTTHPLATTEAEARTMEKRFDAERRFVTHMMHQGKRGAPLRVPRHRPSPLRSAYRVFLR